MEHLGSEDNLYLNLSGISMNTKVSSDLNTKVGDHVGIYIDTKQIHLFDKETELAIC